MLPGNLQDVHDDAEGPNITGLVIFLRAQHLRSCNNPLITGEVLLPKQVAKPAQIQR